MQLNSPNVLTKWPLASVVKEEKIVVSRSCAVGLSEDQRQPWRGEVHFLNCETLDVKYDFSVADSIVLESGCVFYILGCCFPKEWGEHSIFLSNHLIVLLFKKKKTKNNSLPLPLVRGPGCPRSSRGSGPLTFSPRVWGQSQWGAQEGAEEYLGWTHPAGS